MFKLPFGGEKVFQDENEGDNGIMIDTHATVRELGFFLFEEKTLLRSRAPLDIATFGTKHVSQRNWPWTAEQVQAVSCLLNGFRLYLPWGYLENMIGTTWLVSSEW